MFATHAANAFFAAATSLRERRPVWNVKMSATPEIHSEENANRKAIFDLLQQSGGDVLRIIEGLSSHLQQFSFALIETLNSGGCIKKNGFAKKASMFRLLLLLQLIFPEGGQLPQFTAFRTILGLATSKMKAS